jgi:hypothetical protein
VRISTTSESSRLRMTSSTASRSVAMGARIDSRLAGARGWRWEVVGKFEMVLVTSGWRERMRYVSVGR